MSAMMNASAPGPLLQLLRQETSAAHQQMEDKVRIQDRLKNRDGYRDLLEKFLGWYEPMEDKISQVTARDAETSGLNLDERRKTGWLVDDLKALNLDDAAIRALPRCAALPEVTDPSQAIGCLYVMEGATLGGRHISAMMQGSAVPAEARHFFGSYGAETGEKWKQFIAALENFGRAGGDSTKIAAAAKASFASMEAWVCGT